MNKGELEKAVAGASRLEAPDRLKLAPETTDARRLGDEGRLGHGPGWLWPWPRRPGMKAAAEL